MSDLVHLNAGWPAKTLCGEVGVSTHKIDSVTCPDCINALAVNLIGRDSDSAGKQNAVVQPVLHAADGETPDAGQSDAGADAAGSDRAS